MFELCANKTQLTLRAREPLTSGSVNVYTVHFQFSADWDGLTRTAVFKAGADSRSVLLDDTNTCTIPWEVLARGHRELSVGVLGTREQSVVLPTIWASVGTIHEGAASAEAAQPPPTPELWEQELAQKQDVIRGSPGQLVGFDEDGRAVAVDYGGGSLGVEVASDEETNEMLDEVFGLSGQ